MIFSNGMVIFSNGMVISSNGYLDWIRKQILVAINQAESSLKRCVHLTL